MVINQDSGLGHNRIVVHVDSDIQEIIPRFLENDLLNVNPMDHAGIDNYFFTSSHHVEADGDHWGVCIP